MKVTIITVCKNSGRFLDETIKSVAGQTYKNIQYIVIDGNSTDNTIDIIKKHSACISTWLSEEDNGMYDAINKGLKLAQGDYILIVNSDDTLVNEHIISDVVNCISEERLDYYYGDIIKTKNGKQKKVKLFDVNFRQLLLSRHGTFAPHPCFFISTDLNKRLGGYDLNFRFASDYDYILRALSLPGSRGKHMDIFVSMFRLHDNSITASGKIDDERQKILKKYGYYQVSAILRIWSYYSLWIYYKLKNRGAGY